MESQHQALKVEMTSFLHQSGTAFAGLEDLIVPVQFRLHTVPQRMEDEQGNGRIPENFMSTWVHTHTNWLGCVLPVCKREGSRYGDQGRQALTSSSINTTRASPTK